MATWAAPGRVNLIGEHTDYNDGYVAPLAIPQRTRVTVTPRSDAMVTLWSTQAGPADPFPVTTAPGQVGGWAAYAAGVFWALRQLGHALPGVDVGVDSEVPMGAGLSSSAALECALALAIDVVAGLGLDGDALARAAQRVETDYVGVPCGVMDQLASMYGRAGHVMLIDCRSLDVQHVPADLAAAGLALLVVDTRARRALAGGSYAARRRECEAAARALEVPALRDAVLDDLARLDDRVLTRRARHVVTENARVLAAVDAVRTRAWDRLATFLTESHASLRDDFQVSSPELDLAVETVLTNGALGARMTGAGFGGSAIALVSADKTATVRSACVEAFVAQGHPPPRVFEVTPAEGAGRYDLPGSPGRS